MVGAAMLMVPTLVGPNPIFDGFKAALRLPGWVLLGVGLLVLVVHAARQQRQARSTTTARGKGAQGAGSNLQTPPSYDQSAARRILKVNEDEGAVPKPNSPGAFPTHLAHERLTHWSHEVFAAIEWRRFESVVETLFAQAGFETKAKSHGADGGVDIWLHSRHASGPVGVVQCKHWQGKPVPVSAIREFFGVMASHGLQRGTYATTSRFTTDALAFARANGINAQDGDGLLKLIATRTREQQAALLAIAFEGEYWRPTCASCGVKMVDRTARGSGQQFWGCVNYPRCKTTLPMTKRARRAAAQPS